MKGIEHEMGKRTWKRTPTAIPNHHLRLPSFACSHSQRRLWNCMRPVVFHGTMSWSGVTAL